MRIFFSLIKMRGMVLLALATSGIYLHLLGCDDDVSRIDMVDPTSDHYQKNKVKMEAIRKKEQEELRKKAREKNLKGPKKS